MHDEIETIKLNEEIQQKYQKIGQRLPQYDNAKALFEGLLDQMAEEFIIPYIWLTFTDERNWPISSIFSNIPQYSRTA